MSCKVNENDLADQAMERINTELKIELEQSKYAMGAPPKYIYPYEIVNQDVYLPFSYAHRLLRIPRRIRKEFSSTNVRFEGKLRPNQVEVKKEAMDYLNKKGSVIVSCYTGFGKTCGAIDLACAIGFKTLIIVNKIVLMKQWEESILKFCPEALVQRLTPASKMKDCDFYIMNAINVPKVTRNYFEDIGMLIVDEAHLIMAETLSKSMQYIHPRYLVGLTATPYRPDGLDILLELYFGRYKIVRKLWKKHTAFVVNTGFTPKVEKTAQNRLNWGVVLDSQAKDEARNELIISIIQLYKERNFLVLVKRVEQGEHLVKRLKQEKESVTSLLGKNQEFEQTARILIGTAQKVGCGFDHARLDALLLAADLEEYFIQYMGRVFRTQDVEPLIFDLVDNNPILKKHFNTRRGVYIEHGGTVRQFDMSVFE